MGKYAGIIGVRVLKLPIVVKDFGRGFPLVLFKYMLNVLM